jgi:hypothetical protein
MNRRCDARGFPCDFLKSGPPGCAVDGSVPSPKALLWRDENAVQGGLGVFLISVSVTTMLDMNRIFRGNGSR